MIRRFGICFSQRTWLVMLLFFTATSCNRRRSNCVPTEYPPIGSAPILLFVGTGTSPCDVVALQTILDNQKLNYETVNSAQLNALSEAALSKYKLAIFPGGNFIAMGKSLTTASARNIQTAVHNGLNYLGICAGAFLAGNSKYYNGFNLTGITFDFYSAEGKGAHKLTVPIQLATGSPMDQYWEDGPQLSGWGAIVGKYPDGTPAITEGSSRKGWIILTGTHTEAPEQWHAKMDFYTSAATSKKYAATIIRAALTKTVLPHY